MESKWINAATAAEYIGISLDVLYRIANSGELRCARVTGRKAIRTTFALCDEFLERQLPQLPQEHK